MLDYNHRPGIAERINAAVDAALEAERAATPPRDYLGGVPAGPCLRTRAAVRVRGRAEGRGPGLLRPVAADLRDRACSSRISPSAGCGRRGSIWYTARQPATAAQFGFSVAGGRIRGHVDGIVAEAPAALGLRTPALWECKTMNAKNWRETVAKGVTVAKPVYAAQIALYQAYMEATVPGISANPALFTAINKDTAELHHELVPFDADLAQRMSDRGVRILRATDAGELLPRIAANRDFFECRFCPWAERCWSLPA